MADFKSPIDTRKPLLTDTEGEGRVIQDRSAEIKGKAVEQAIGAVSNTVKAKVQADTEEKRADVKNAREVEGQATHKEKTRKPEEKDEDRAS